MEWWESTGSNGHLGKKKRTDGEIRAILVSSYILNRKVLPVEFDTNPRIIGSLDDSRETAQAVYDALNSRHFGSFCNAVFFITQFTSKPRAYSLNGKEITGYEIKGKNLGLMIRNSILRFHSLITGRQFEENWNYKLRFPVGGRVEVEIHETLCKSKKCNRTYTNSTLEAHGVDYFDLVMMDYSK